MCKIYFTIKFLFYIHTIKNVFNSFFKDMFLKNNFVVILKMEGKNISKNLTFLTNLSSLL